MSRPFLFSPILLIASLVLIVGCSDTTKYQAEMRGAWELQSRKMPPDKVVEAPAISGRFEWFPTQKDQAHLFMSISTQKDAITLIDGTCTMKGDAFSLNSQVRIGGSIQGPAEASVETNNAITTSGKISSDDARLVMEYSNGTKYEFIGAQLTVSYPNGVEDIWKRLKDQKGALAN